MENDTENQEDDISLSNKDIDISAFNSRVLFFKNIKKIAIAVACLIIILLVIIVLFKSKRETSQEVGTTTQEMELDAGTKAVNTEKMWRQNLEDKQADLNKNLKSEIESLKQELNQKAASNEDQKNQEINYLKEKLSFIQAELENKTQEPNIAIEDSIEKMPKITRHVVHLTNGKNDKDYEPLKTADNYIPAGTMIEAATLNGLRASTSVSSMSNPDEMLIQLTDYGILPNDFRNNLKDCVIVADAYGDLSSETVKIRTSKLSCIEKETGESIETDLVGMVVGQDGYAGIKGTIVSIDQKYLANASIFGIMSGLAGIGVKDSTTYNPYTVATGAVQPMTDKQRVTNNLLQGGGNSMDKLSDYYIAHAERIQPVIEIDRGRPVTVAVLKGTYIGTSTLKKAESKKRDNDIKRTAEETDNLLNNIRN